MPRTGLGPSIRILPLSGRSRAADSGPESFAGAVDDRRPARPGSFDGRARERASPHEPRIDLRGEWSLAAFTLLLAILFALLAADLAGARQVSAALFAGIAALAAALSLAHLGRPGRAWRAVLGVRRSPVSREVLGFGSLSALGTAALLWPDPAVGAMLGGALFDANLEPAGTSRLGLADNRGLSGDGYIAYLDFSVVGEAGSTTPIRGSVTTATRASDDQPVSIRVKHGRFTVLANALQGDGNDAGRITSLDALMALRMSIGKLPVDLILDVNGDNRVTALDARWILQAATGLRTL